MQRTQLEMALESAERIVTAGDALRALEAVEGFECNLTKCKRGNNAYNLLKRMREQIEEARYSLITEYYTAERHTLLEVLRRFDRIYRERKRAAGALDFSDLEEFTVRLLENHEDTRDRVRAQFDHILMDEFQDTNGQQARLMQLVRSPGNFYAVGDINQSIFGFRHAEPEGFARYQEEVAGRGRPAGTTDRQFPQPGGRAECGRDHQSRCERHRRPVPGGAERIRNAACGLCGSGERRRSRSRVAMGGAAYCRAGG